MKDIVVPSARQLAFQERQFGAFIHFGMATWYEGPEHGVFPATLREPYAFNLGQWGSMTAQPPASVFNPRELEADQWMAAAKAMGARHVVLTAKHHNGFCLWPTESTPYSVRHSPWRSGRGDVLREFAGAARRAGLGVGIYLSAGDVSQGCFSTPEPQGERRLVGDIDRYITIFETQFREVLTGYGAFCEIWLDGALDPFGPDVTRPDGSKIGTAYWDRLIGQAREWQPGAVIMGGSKPDVRWPGNEEGLAPYPLWCVVEPGQEAANWVPPGSAGWIVPEADVFTRPTWFWTPESDHQLFSLERLCDVYDRSIGHGANLLVNMTPDRRGLIPEAEAKRLEEFGNAIRARFGQPLAETASAGRGQEVGLVLELAWGRPAEVSTIVLEEDLRFGQRIIRHRLEAECDGVWKTVADGESIGRKRIVSIKPVTTRRLRLQVLESAPLPNIRFFGAYA